jgi:hypothetical protein
VEHKAKHTTGEHQGMHKHYPHLYLMAALSFVAMFILMYAMVDSFSNVFINLNQFYMAGLMSAPMVLIELLVMRAMFPNKRLNTIIAVVSVVALLLFWFGIREQAAIGNAQFLRSMIPHHAGAILMCKESRANDAEIKKLCEDIIRSQSAEIAQMRAKLDQLD